MSRITKFVACAVTVLALFWGANANADEHQTFQHTNLIDFDAGFDLFGAATLRRTKHELWATVNATGLDTGAGYTVWFVLFNRSNKCAGVPCALSDLGNPKVKASIYYATGFVTGADGVANVSMHTSDRGPAEGVDVLIPGGLRRGNGFGVEVHLIVRSHKDLVLGAVGSQIGTFSGECGPGPDFALCMDQMAAVFLGVDGPHH